MRPTHYTKREAADRLRVSVRTIDRRLAERVLRAVRPRGSRGVLILAAEVEALLAEGLRMPRVAPALAGQQMAHTTTGRARPTTGPRGRRLNTWELD